MDIVVVPIMAALEGISSALASIGIPYSFGFAIIVFTLLIKLVTAPLNAKQIKSSRAMQEMQPKLQELQKKYKDNKEELAKRQMVAEPTSTGWLLQSPANWNLPYVAAYIVLPVLTVVTQLLLQKMMTPKNADPQASTMNQMMMLMPFMFGFFAIQVPSGLSLYWVTMNLFSGVQQYLMTGWGGLAPKKAVATTDMAKKKDSLPQKDSAPVKAKADPVPNPPSAPAKKGQATRARKRKR